MSREYQVEQGERAGVLGDQLFKKAERRIEITRVYVEIWVRCDLDTTGWTI